MDKIFDFDEELLELNISVEQTETNVENVSSSIEDTTYEIDNLYAQLRNFPGVLRVLDNDEIADLNSDLEHLLPIEFKNKLGITPTDVIIAVVAGFIASVIDIVFVGTPEVVKVYKGGENFDGSILTSLLRKMGDDGDASKVLKWLSKKCTVPYDISVLKDTVQPNNHRLRNPGHDPLLGLLFAIVDILLGTATLIDNNGALKIIVRDVDYPITEKIFSVIYYIGHLLSDVCTSRGLPIPGFFLTQFFTDGKYGPNKESLAKIAENMYRDGYDLRHLFSMSSPVVVKDLIITIYYYIFHQEEIVAVNSIADKEIKHNKYIAIKYKLLAISDAVACSGNIIKFFLETTAGNITALNLPEWISLIKNGLISIKYDCRDKTIEKAIYNRETINSNWEILLRNSSCLLDD